MAATQWVTGERTLDLQRTLVMGVLNLTPDSFSDGGRYASPDRALARAEELLAAGADIIDIGGESTRPGGAPVPAAEERARVLPVIEALRRRSFPAPISLDTTKAEVARAGLEAGVEIINDISGLRFDPAVATEAARAGAGLVLMHSRGEADRLHGLEPVADIFAEVSGGWRQSLAEAERRGVRRERIALDPGLGFGKSDEQNLALLARLDRLAEEFAEFPLLVGASRKSFIGRLLGGAPPDRRLYGTMATVTASILGGAQIVRVHDVAAAVETARVTDALKRQARHHARR